jgi:enoyl-CoA hydratase/carnithine racemase
VTSDVDTSNWKKTPDGIAIPPPSPDDVLYESRGEVGWITLNRPVVLNAMNKSVQRALGRALDAAEADTEAKAFVLIGAGRAFSAGGDLWSSLYPDDQPAPNGDELKRRIFDFDRPFVAAVRGAAVGQGFELAAVCDLTIASETARMGEIQIRHGFGPPLLITPYLVSLKHAKEILLLGETLTADEAYRMGVVNKVVADDQLEAAAEETARKLAKLPVNTVKLNKALVNRVYKLASMDEGLDYRSDQSLADLFSGRDSVAQERHRLREEQGWDAFKSERDKGYS